MTRTARQHGGMAVSRRRLLALLGGAAGTAILAACGDEAAATPTAAPRLTTGTTGTTSTTGAASAVAPTSASAATTAPSAVTTTGGASAVAPTVTRAASAVTGATTPAGAASAVAATTVPTTAPATTGAASAVAPTTGAASAVVATPTRAASAVTGTTAAGSAAAGTTAMGSASASANMLPTLDIESFDYGYRTVLGAVPGGWTLVRQRNTGKETHHVQFIRLRDGVTQVQLLAALMGANVEATIAMLTMNVGGPGAVEPGGVSEAIINLQAGPHFLVCYIPSPDGTPHLVKGMVLPLQVTPGPAGAARLPETLGTVTMTDFAFQMPVSTVNPGKSYWNVTNVGMQPHEFIIARLQPGKMPADITRFFAERRMGSPPFALVGGMQGLERGMSGIAVLDLPAGDYAAICQIPDPMSGKNHLLLGMIAGLSVK